MAQVRQRCADGFCGLSLVPTKDGANTAAYQFPLGISELVKAENVEPMVNRCPGIPLLFLPWSPTISAGALPSSRIRIQKILLAYYVFIRRATHDRSAGHRQAQTGTGSKREVPHSRRVGVTVEIRRLHSKPRSGG